jgi:hypothetical protein
MAAGTAAMLGAAGMLAPAAQAAPAPATGRAAGGTVKIHTGSGHRSQTDRYWNSGWYIWNNDGDGAALKNANGAVKSRCSYSDPGEDFAFTSC